MKMTLILALFTASFAFGDEIQHFVRSSTNENFGGSSVIRVVTRDCFMRNGSTNLLCVTDTRNGQTTFRMQEVFHGRQKAVSFLWGTNGASVLVETGLTFFVETRFRTDGNLGSVTLMTADEGALDMFNATNGLLYPAQDTQIKEANKRLKDAGAIAGTPNH